MKKQEIIDWLKLYSYPTGKTDKDMSEATLSFIEKLEEENTLLRIVWAHVKDVKSAEAIQDRMLGSFKLRESMKALEALINSLPESKDVSK